MDDGGGGGRLSLLDRRLPPPFRLRTVALAPGRELAFDEAEWRDALVVVERGEIELECPDGSRERFGRGDVLCLVGVALRALRNPGGEAVLLVAVSRR
jgi:quercetin dioxygenase-like cupin family protein